MATSVAVQENDWLATTFGGIKESGAVNSGGVGVATVWLAAYSQNGDGQEGEDCFLEMFQIDFGAGQLSGRARWTKEPGT